MLRCRLDFSALLVRFSAIMLVVGGLTTGLPTASAQGLIWKLPDKEGTWVRYEGTYTQINKPATATDEEVTLEWLRQLTIKLLNQEMAEYARPLQTPQMVNCRWVEFKVVTGKAGAMGIDPGPVGQRVYKVLIPESEVGGKLTDSDGIPVSFIPIVKGFLKIGNGDPEPIEGNVLRVYPTICLLRHYETLEPPLETPGDAVDPEVGVAGVTATHHTAAEQMENTANRWTHDAELWLSDQVPFGLARWKVRILRERKLSNQPRSEFVEASETLVEMKAQAVGDDATSELNVP